MNKHHYGWKADTYDDRDHKYSVAHPLGSRATDLPVKVDMTKGMSSVYDQGDLGSCTANMGISAYEYALGVKLNVKAVNAFSRLALYYETRKLEGTTRKDAGATIRDTYKAIGKIGLALETECPYVVKNFAKVPSKAALTEMPKHLALEYVSVSPDLLSLRTALSQSYPVGIGITVYESFESDAVAKSGIVPLPSRTEQVLGGHAVLLVGYDDTKKVFLVRNSWGTGWGQQGYFTLPYAYVTNPKLASDFWILRTVEG